MNRQAAGKRWISFFFSVGPMKIKNRFVHLYFFVPRNLEITSHSASLWSTPKRLSRATNWNIFPTGIPINLRDDFVLWNWEEWKKCKLFDDWKYHKSFYVFVVQSGGKLSILQILNLWNYGIFLKKLTERLGFYLKFFNFIIYFTITQ